MSQPLRGFGFYLPGAPHCGRSSASAAWVGVRRSPAEVLSRCRGSLLLWCSASSLEQQKNKNNVKKKKKKVTLCASWGQLAKLVYIALPI